MEANKRRAGLRAWTVLGLFCLALAGCGGGGGGGGGSGSSSSGGGGSSASSSSGGSASSSSSSSGGTSSSSSSGGSSSSSGGTALNQGLPGVLYFDTSSDYVGLELDNGLVAALRPKGSGASTSYDGFPSADGSRFGMVLSKPIDGSLSNNEFDAFQTDGRSAVRIEKAQWLNPPAKPSPDNSKVLVNWYNESNGESCCIPTVFDSSGNVVQRFSGYTDWDWLPGGGLLLAKGDSIYKVDSSLTNLSLLKQFTGDTPTFLSVSPDGSQVAFDLGALSATQNHVWVMNIDGSGLRQLTSSSLNEDGASWSPDSQYISVRYAIPYSAIFGGLPGASCPTLYIVPASASKAPVGASNPAPAFQVQQFSGGASAKVCAFTAAAWRAKPAALAAAAGTAAPGGGSNSGLSGTMVYAAAGAFESLNVSSGALSTLSHSGGSSASDPYLSSDGSLISYIVGSGGATQVDLEKPDGTAQSSSAVSQGLLGPAKLAPGNQQFASTYLGNSGEPVVGVFTIASGPPGPAFDLAGEYSWLPDGRLALAAQNVLALSTDKTLAKLASVATLSDAISGLAASADGSRFAFAMDGHIWTINNDGSGLKQLTVSSGEESLPAWSPDGKFVALQYAASCPQLLAVPADGQRVFVGNPAVPGNTVTLAGGGSSTLCANSAVSWH